VKRVALECAHVATRVWISGALIAMSVGLSLVSRVIVVCITEVEQ
jgi:hypothetical protein